ncbi:hypothetical protein [Rhodobaculum claviforme]|uniref:DUF7742 domain-containing protein n=1 Tax=Rhodobaculum claviforme TaxID=1549854 RepID=A0A934WJR3_9RHOB|nr:hypothetical protein [Rhodobaculum claviforme]MBK5928306.1 hypothetical protein [Rhodobaculum claviforme]
MRPVLHGDVVAAARVLLCVPEVRRGRVMAELLRAADLADRYRRVTGRVHPDFGTGSLLAASAAWTRQDEPALDDPEYLDCLVAVLVALRRRVARPARHADGRAGPCVTATRGR